MRPLNRTFRTTCKVVIAIAAINFIACFVGAMWIGGDAINGKRSGDQFFVGNHGRYTEVSRGTWQYSRAHVISVFVTHPLALGCGWLLMAGKRRSDSL